MPASTSLQHNATPKSTSKLQGLTTRPKLVPPRSTAPRTAAPGEWKPTDRWAWACGLPVSGIARAVAGCIARHANARTGVGWPGMGTIAKETGFCRRAVVKAIKDLERGGHVTVTRFKVGKKNTANRYQLPPMGGATGELGGVVDGGGGSARDALPSAPDALGGSAPDAPELVRTESVKNNSAARARVVCEQADDQKACTCGDSYRNSYDRRCTDCEGRPSPAQLDAVRPASTPPPIAETEKHDGGVQTTPPRTPAPVEREDDPPPKSDPDALLRWWKDARAQYGRKQTPTTEGDTA